MLQMALLVACGIGWRLLRPGGVDADDTRRVIAALVYHLLLPALVLGVLWRAPVGMDALRIAAAAAIGVVAALLAAAALYRWMRVDRPAMGALVLAAAFGNVTYLGLPVLEALFGPWARVVAVEYDLFASAPLLL